MVSKEEYERRKKDGICTKCGKKNDTNTVLCNFCREKQRIIKYEKRKNNIKDGLCSTCGKEKDGEQQECEFCRNRRNARKKQKKIENIKNKICINCNKNEATEKNGCCKGCSEQRKIKFKERYEKRKSSDKCVTCGKEIEDGWKLLNCKKCSEKQNENRKIDYRFLLSNGICPRCRKNSIYLKEKSCYECLEKEQNRKKQSYDKKKYAESYHKRMILYKEKGLCRSCGKKAVVGKTYCNECLLKKRERDKKKRRELNDDYFERTDRVSYGKCFFCGEEVMNGKKVCENHYNMCMVNLEKANMNNDKKEHFWKNDNKIVFLKRGANV